MIWSCTLPLGAQPSFSESESCNSAGNLLSNKIPVSWVTFLLPFVVARSFLLSNRVDKTLL